MSGLKIAQWGTCWGVEEAQALSGVLVDLMPGPTQMLHSTATGLGLVTNGDLGVDLIRLRAGEGFVPHTHPGDHILIVVGGLGTITFDGCVYPTEPGNVYMVGGAVPHAVGARTAHAILAVGAPHRAVDDPDRMAPIEYQAVVSESVGDMTCLACAAGEHGGSPITATFPTLLHQIGCTHCPCFHCVSTGEPDLDARLRAGLDAAVNGHVYRMEYENGDVSEIPHAAATRLKDA